MPASLAEVALWVTVMHSMFWRQSLGIQKPWSFHFLSGNWATKWRSPDHPARETRGGPWQDERSLQTVHMWQDQIPSQHDTKNPQSFYSAEPTESSQLIPWEREARYPSETGPNPRLTEQLGRKRGREGGRKEERKKMNICASKPLPFKQCFLIANFYTYMPWA